MELDFEDKKWFTIDEKGRKDVIGEFDFNLENLKRIVDDYMNTNSLYQMYISRRLLTKCGWPEGMPYIIFGTGMAMLDNRRILMAEF